MSSSKWISVTIKTISLLLTVHIDSVSNKYFFLARHWLFSFQIDREMNFFDYHLIRVSVRIDLSVCINETTNDYQLSDMETSYPRNYSSVESIGSVFENVFSNDKLRNTIDEPVIWMKIVFNIRFETSRQRSFIQFDCILHSKVARWKCKKENVFSRDKMWRAFFVLLFWERIFVLLDQGKSSLLVHFIQNNVIARNGQVCLSISLHYWFLSHRKHRPFDWIGKIKTTIPMQRYFFGLQNGPEDLVTIITSGPRTMEIDFKYKTTLIHMTMNHKGNSAVFRIKVIKTEFNLLELTNETILERPGPTEQTFFLLFDSRRSTRQWHIQVRPSCSMTSLIVNL